jgi:hypothetical protein
VSELKLGQSRLIAEIWCCDDELDGLCYRPQIRRVTGTQRGFPRHEGIWEGTFVNSPEPGELIQLKAELREAAARYGIPLTEKDGWLPFGDRDE